jgi:quercetin dioxygenase-like cupin family protein
MMKIKAYADQPTKVFDGGPAKAATGRVAIGREDGAAHFCMRAFELGENGYTPKHAHEWEHEIFFHQGEGEVFSEGEIVSVKAGDVAFIPGGEMHQIRNVGRNKLVFVCLIPSGYPEL